MIRKAWRKKKELFEGIKKVNGNRRQPYQVWWEGRIVWFAYTEKEAQKRLDEIRLKAKQESS